ncbi:hypothetical protein [Streptomyces sp. NPDC002851]
MSELEALREALREELNNLWDDLSSARDSALKGQWSMRCDFLTDRIKKLTVLVGPTPWRNIDLALVEDGIYQRVHAVLGVEAPVDMEAVAQARVRINEDRQGMRLRHAT